MTSSGRHRAAATAKPPRHVGAAVSAEAAAASSAAVPVPPLCFRYLESQRGEMEGELLIVLWLCSVALVQQSLVCGGSIANANVELVCMGGGIAAMRMGS